MKQIIQSSAISAMILLGASSSLSALDWGMTAGAHDFVVQDIVNDTPNDGLSAGDSHTLGLNVGVYLEHTTDYGIYLGAKAEAFLDYDKDELDSDHIPVWFKFYLDANGPMIKFNENHMFKWYVLMDNRQNTVSCVEREVRQHIGVGYNLQAGGFTLDANAYAGFYYIEIDDDTPVSRGYNRQQTDDGEASNVLELEMSYAFAHNWYVYGGVRHYSANAGFEKLETDYQALLSYKTDWWGKGTSLNLNIEYNDYDLSRFTVVNSDTQGLPILPFENDMLVQAYVTIPFGN
jgi:hypothetical protein